MEVADKAFKAAIITMLKYIKENMYRINKFQQTNILKDENSRTEKYLKFYKYIWMDFIAECRWQKQVNKLEIRSTEIIQYGEQKIQNWKSINKNKNTT